MSMKTIKETLKELVYYYVCTRMVGHTSATINGLKNSPDAILVVSTQGMGGHISENFHTRRDTKMKSIYQIKKNGLRGYKSPIIFDNAALYEIFSDALDRINKLENMLNEAITLADIMSDEINQNWCKESKLAVAKLNLLIEKAGWNKPKTSD